MSTLKVMRRTHPETERHIITQILLGYPYPDIADSTGVAVSTIKKIKARNKMGYEASRIELQSWSVERAKASLQRAYALLDSYLDEGLANTRSVTMKELLLIADRMLLHEQIIKMSANNDPFSKRQKDLDQLLSKLKRK